MDLAFDNLVPFLATLILLGLSSAIILWATEGARPFRTESEYLFQGRELGYSIAGNVGSVFSVTYFFGATFLYGRMFGPPILVAVALAFVTVGVVVLRVARRSELVGEHPSNRLLDLLADRYGCDPLNRVLSVYALIYFLLLVVELAVARHVLSAVVGGQAAVVAFLIVTTCFVVYSYIYVGGFRAALTADGVQTLVLTCFLIMLLFLIRDAGPIQSNPLERSYASARGPGLLAIYFYGTAWFAAGTDFYSRLNFTSQRADRRRTELAVVLASLALMLLVLSVGALFGMHLFENTTVPITPSTYVHATTQFFLDSRSVLVPGVFLAGLFSMVFTTVNTLLLVLLQTGDYLACSPASNVGRGPFLYRSLRRAELSKILLAAVAASTLLSIDDAGTLGVFVGALFLIPAVAVVGALLPKPLQDRLVDTRALAMAAVVSFVVFGSEFRYFREHLDHHFDTTYIVAASVALCTASITVGRHIRTRRHS